MHDRYFTVHFDEVSAICFQFLSSYTTCFFSTNCVGFQDDNNTQVLPESMPISSTDDPTPTDVGNTQAQQQHDPTPTEVVNTHAQQQQK